MTNLRFGEPTGDEQVAPFPEPLHSAVIKYWIECSIHHYTLHLGNVPGVPVHEASAEVDPGVLHPEETSRHVVHHVDEEREVAHQEQSGEHGYRYCGLVLPPLYSPGSWAVTTL